MSETTILLVDDHPVVRAGYRKLIERQPGFRVVAEAQSAAEAYLSYRRAAPDLVILDLSLPGASGLEAIRRIRAYDRAARILVFSMHQGAPFALKSFEAGASGYVTKSSAPEELIAAMRSLSKGGRTGGPVVSEDIAREIAAERLSGRRSPIEDLGPREVEILGLIASGMTTDAIAGALALSTKTVQNYHSAIKAKLNLRTDADLVWLAVSAGLVKAKGG